MRVTYRNILDGQVHDLLDNLTTEQADLVATNSRAMGFTEVTIQEDA